MIGAFSQRETGSTMAFSPSRVHAGKPFLPLLVLRVRVAISHIASGFWLLAGVAGMSPMLLGPERRLSRPWLACSKQPLLVGVQNP
jgi:hypothetical protein